MTAGCERTQRRADPSGVSRVSNGAPPSTEGVMMGHHAAVVRAEDVDWLVAHLQAVVAANCAIWAGRSLTLVQLTALHLIGALAPVGLLDRAQALGTKAPATSAMVDRLSHAGLVRRTLDPRDRRCIQLTLTAEAEPIIGDTDPDTARRLQAVLTAMSPQTRRHLIDMLIDTVRRSAEQPSTPAAANHLSQPSPGPVPVPGGSARGPDSASGYAGEWGVKISSDIASLRGIRQCLATWARTTGLSSAAVDDLVLASYEAVANSMEHAYRGRVGDILLSAERKDHHVIVTVTDHGQWLAPSTPSRHRGRGLFLMHELADDAHITVDEDHPGTTVHLRWRLDKQAGSLLRIQREETAWR